MYDNSCNYKDRCSCADMHYTVVALGSMKISISLVIKHYHSIRKPITKNISMFFDNESHSNIMFINLYIRI